MITFRQFLEETKESKKSVNFREGTPEKHCSQCTMFRAGSCTAVEGHIGENDLCDLFERKS